MSYTTHLLEERDVVYHTPPGGCPVYPTTSWRMPCILHTHDGNSYDTFQYTPCGGVGGRRPSTGVWGAEGPPPRKEIKARCR